MAEDRDEMNEQDAPGSGFSWQLQPDPTAADPKLADSAGSKPRSRGMRSGPVGGAEPERSGRAASENATEPLASPREPEAQPRADAEPHHVSAAPEPTLPTQAKSDQPAPTDPDIGDDLGYWFGASDADDSHSDVETLVADTGPTATDLPVPTAAFATAGMRSSGLPANPPVVPIPGEDATTPLQSTIGAVDVASADAQRRGDAGGGRRGGRGRPPKSDRSNRRTLWWLVGTLIALVVLAGLFVLGTQIPGFLAGPPVAAPTPTPTATPTPTPEPTAPLPVGTHEWDTLFGGECIDPFDGPWAEEFTVVDCAAPHAAQLVHRGAFEGDATTTFPGEAELAAQINALCTSPGVIDLPAASGIPDLQVQGSFPVTEEQWTEGMREYYCFVNRGSGEPITGSIAGPGPGV